MLRPTLALLLVLALACGKEKPKYSEEIVGREEYVASPGWAPGEAGATSAPPPPAATSASGGPPPPAPKLQQADCEVEYETPKAGGISSVLQCGGFFGGTTEGGTSSFGDEFYQRAFCSPARKRYDDSPEAIYAFELPANNQATITLDSPCAELDLVAIAWTLDGLPTTAQVGRVRECEMNAKSGGGTVTLTSVDRAQTFLIVVDGQEGQSGNFSLKADCKTYR